MVSVQALELDTRVQVQALAVNFSEPQFLYLLNGDNDA